MNNLDIANIPCLILAGGKGTRLKEAVSDRPKPMAMVKGKPFLSHLFDWLEKCGIRKTILCTGYKSEIIENYFQQNYNTLQISYSHEPSAIGTGGALALASRQVRQNYCFAINGDSFINENLGKLFSFATEHTPDCGVIFLRKVKDTSRYGRVMINEQNQIEKFAEKSSAQEGYINAGIYLLKTAILHSIPTDKNCSLENDIFPNLCKKGFYGLTSDAAFIDIGTPESYRTACEKGLY